MSLPSSLLQPTALIIITALGDQVYNLDDLSFNNLDSDFMDCYTRSQGNLLAVSPTFFILF